MDAVTIIIVLAIVAPFILIGIRRRRARKTAGDRPLPAKFELRVQPVAGGDTITSPPLSLWAWYSSRSWLSIVTIPLSLFLIIACALFFLDSISKTTDLAAVLSRVLASYASFALIILPYFYGNWMGQMYESKKWMNYLAVGAQVGFFCLVLWATYGTHVDSGPIGTRSAEAAKQFRILNQPGRSVMNTA